ncbi:MAG: DUF2497 domain-containing protein [Novosphingobium meiothermophilum]|uniref:DUF2497 domain-containing protein n=1 Tax=Novosphingobium TaxID=165696 RepID=UPI000D6E3D3E|nr:MULTISPECIES: DUF2497 domain-containing protein [Novosphingobium]
MRQAGEPSVEEILESIKKVIARDSRADLAARSRPGPVAEARPVPRADVLELTETADADEEDGGLIADTAATAMRESLAALSMLAQPGAAPQIVRSGETSLEGLVRDLLRPMLADWLDRNLPAMVERMVAAEIARIAGKRG